MHDLRSAHKLIMSNLDKKLLFGMHIGIKKSITNSEKTKILN